LEIENRILAVHSLFILFKKGTCKVNALLIPFLNNLNNLRTVARLGVDKFTSHAKLQSNLSGACELANTLRLEEDEFITENKKAQLRGLGEAMHRGREYSEGVISEFKGPYWPFEG